MKKKALDVTNMLDLKEKVNDVKVHGDPGKWKCLNKASSESQGWMKSTKVLDIFGVGCLVQTETQQRNPDGSWALSQALVFVKSVCFNDLNT